MTSWVGMSTLPIVEGDENDYLLSKNANYHSILHVLQYLFLCKHAASTQMGDKHLLKGQGRTLYIM